MASTTKRKTATKRNTARKRAPSKSKAKGRARSTRKRAPSKTAAPVAPVAFARSIHDRLGDQARDVYGIALIGIGFVFGLALFAGKAGLLGDTLVMLLKGLGGVWAYALPPLSVYGGATLMLTDPDPDRAGKAGVGLTICVAATVGLWHLAVGAPTLADGIDAVHAGSGLLGLAITAPLATTIGTWGAVSVLLAAAGGGALVATGTPLRQMLRRDTGAKAPDLSLIHI